ncbi:MAG: UDP-N-acetylmuramoyl-L-alanyl-D-glutamate--2,6-diaminopimelate ligase, partial [Pseudonocardiales bacterium]|nr:UDP-N-acetylmuramoyl-L-alanyl-D-glutamate--2,6-diaminopimelate ligase [Pseudonocardiales bacterium]
MQQPGVPRPTLVRPVRLSALADGALRGADVEVTGVTSGTAFVRPGDLFAALPGTRTHGAAHVPDALAAGAVAVLTDEAGAALLERDLPLLVVDDVRRVLGPISARVYEDPSRQMSVLGVTGTSGKTTTTFLLYAILAAAGRRPGLIGTIESRLGGERRKLARTTPEAIDLQRLFREMLDSGDCSCAIEASSHASALGRLDGTRFAALVFTILSQDHLDFHRDMDDYFEAKRRLFGAGVPAAVNVGDEHGRRLAAELGDALTFGFADDAEIRADDLELSAAGARFTAGGIELETRLRGRFNVENVLGAVAAARLLGIEDEPIARGV